MEARKLLNIKNSLFINIPMSISEELKLKKGDVLWIGKLSKDGLIVTKSKSAGKVEAGVAGVDRIKIVCDHQWRELLRKSKALQNSFINNVLLRLQGELMSAGIIDLKLMVKDAVDRLVALEMKNKKSR
jgi:bifunctional DNA-binding transcriptional regulator/antitoxin component of YhaV-PrlF toxin-antitoxin module